MNRFNRSSIFNGALFVLALLALLPGRSVLADDWSEITQGDARISLDTPSLRDASEYHAQEKVRYGIAEFGSWEARTGDFPRAEVYAQILQNARFNSKFDLKNMMENWDFLEGKNLKFEGRNSYWNSLGQGRYRTFSFQDHECVAFRQFWGSLAETRGVDAGTRMLIGYYCGPSGVSLSEQTIENLLDSVRVRSDGDLTVATNTSQTTEDFDGRWVLEIADTRRKSRTDRRVIEIKNGRFSVEVSTNGWRGTVAGEIDGSGNLAGNAVVKKLNHGRHIETFNASFREGEFHAKTTGQYAYVTFMIGLTRAAALSEAECVSTECEAKDEQTTGSSPDNESNLQELVSANGALTPSPESQVVSAPGEEQQAALPEADDEIDGEWVLEIREPSYMPSGDKVTVNVVDGRFTANVSANGWRGSVSGRIDRSGILVASGYLRNPPKPSALLKWSSEPSGNRYNAKIPASTNFLSMTFEVSLYR